MIAERDERAQSAEALEYDRQIQELQDKIDSKTAAMAAGQPGKSLYDEVNQLVTSGLSLDEILEKPPKS